MVIIIKKASERFVIFNWFHSIVSLIKLNYSFCYSNSNGYTALASVSRYMRCQSNWKINHLPRAENMQYSFASLCASFLRELFAEIFHTIQQIRSISHTKKGCHLCAIGKLFDTV